MLSVNIYMRAWEFVVEARDRIVRTGIRMPRHAHDAAPGVHRVAGTADRHYDLNRIMMTLAGSDGKHCEHVPTQSWAGKNNLAAPYTRVEADMLRHAYRLNDADWDDVLKPNRENRSRETDDTGKRSPLKPFRGY